MILVEVTVRCDLCGREYTETVEDPDLRSYICDYLPIEMMLVPNVDGQYICFECEEENAH